MSNKLTVMSRQPTAAFGNWDNVPGSQDKTYHVSEHKVSVGGLKNALSKRASEIREYAESYGSGAIQKCWIELDGKKLSSDVLSVMVECNDEFTGVDGFRKKYTEAAQLIARVNAELDARYAQ